MKHTKHDLTMILANVLYKHAGWDSSRQQYNIDENHVEYIASRLHTAIKSYRKFKSIKPKITKTRVNTIGGVWE